MHNFNYHRAADAADAVSKVKGAEDGKFLAGGMTLLPTLKNRLANPSDLVDLQNLAALKGVSVEGKEVVVKAMTPHADVAASEAVRKAIPALAVLAGWLAWEFRAPRRDELRAYLAENGVGFCKDAKRLTKCTDELANLPRADAIVLRRRQVRLAVVGDGVGRRSAHLHHRSDFHRDSGLLSGLPGGRLCAL